MAQANQSDFLGSGGTITDPFAGLVSPPTADDFTAIQAAQERRRREELQRIGDQTSNANFAQGRLRDNDNLESQQTASPGWWEEQFRTGAKDPNALYVDGHPELGTNQDQYKKTVQEQKKLNSGMDSPFYKALTLGILAAPAAITGGAAAFGGPAALGFGGGEAIGGGAGAGGAAATQVANEAVPGAAVAGPGFSPASAGAYNAAIAEAATPGAAASVPTMGGVSSGAAGAAPTATGAASTAGNAAASTGMTALEKGLINGGVQATLPLLIQGLTGGRTAEEKALLAKQQQMAEDAQRRQGEVQDARMNTLAQQVLAFNPRNQMLAQMFGPSAAFTPQQMAGVVQGPPPPSLGPNPTPAQQAAYDARMKQYQASEAARQQAIQSGFQQPGAGPRPLNMPAPQAARKY